MRPAINVYVGAELNGAGAGCALGPVLYGEEMGFVVFVSAGPRAVADCSAQGGSYSPGELIEQSFQAGSTVLTPEGKEIIGFILKSPRLDAISELGLETSVARELGRLPSYMYEYSHADETTHHRGGTKYCSVYDGETERYLPTIEILIIEGPCCWQDSLII